MNTPWYVITRLDICPHCGGSTWAQDPHNPHRFVKCQHCNNNGIVQRNIAATGDDVHTAVAKITEVKTCSR